MKTINKIKKYPIYLFTAKWHELHQSDNNYTGLWTIGLPENRIWNSTSYRKMIGDKIENPKDERIIRTLEIDLIDWWRTYTKEKLFNVDPSIPILKVSFVEMETWCLSWFSHYTFNVGQDDNEVITSFEIFVSEKIQQNREKGREDGYGLMGADERWRWRGEKENSHPPCRCVGCRKYGLIRIVH